MDENRKNTGKIAWIDLTVPDAAKVRDFYSKVVGWRASAVSMGDYSDFSMMLPYDDAPAAGICHTRGVNADLPAQWMIYIIVDDLDKSMDACREMGGKIIAGPKKMGEERYCVIQDPGGAFAALYEKK